MRRRLGPPPRRPNRQPYVAVNEFQSRRDVVTGSAGARRALESLLIGVERRGAVLPHHVVAGIDEGEPNEFGDVQDLHIAEPGESSANAGEQRTDGDKNISKEPCTPLLHREVLDRRVDRSTEKENEGVEIEQRRKRPDPLPLKYSAGEAIVETLRDRDRRSKDAQGRHDNRR